jgi:hypothetical protein
MVAILALMVAILALMVAMVAVRRANGRLVTNFI